MGGAGVHRHRLPARLHAQVPPLPELLAAVGAGALPAAGARQSHPPAGDESAVMSATPIIKSARPISPAEREAYAWCRRYARGRQENFTVVSWFLPRPLRPHFFALYAFCRMTDDLGDEAEGDRLALLDAWEADLRACYAGRREQPIFVALGRTIDVCAVPEDLFLRLIEANRMDQRITRFPTY